MLLALTEISTRALIESNPFDRQESLLIKENNAKERSLGEEEVDRLMASRMPDHAKNIFIGDLHAGMRRREVLDLEWY